MEDKPLPELVDCLTLLLARHLADVSCFIISETIRDVEQTTELVMIQLTDLCISWPEGVKPKALISVCRLTHLPLDKMAAISPTIFQLHFREWKDVYFDCNFTEVCS